MLGWQPSTGLRSEQQEAADELCIDPVYLRARAPQKGKGLDLYRERLLRIDLSRDERSLLAWLHLP